MNLSNEQSNSGGAALALLVFIILGSCLEPAAPDICGTPSECPNITFGTCNAGTEFILVDAEPIEAAPVVQTCPYHLDKQPWISAYISLSLDFDQTAPVLRFWSNETTFATPFFCLDEYTGAFNASLSGDTLTVTLYDPQQFYEYINQQEQFICALHIICTQ